ncbi:hypothetical protein SLA2020_377300 [Shorea laevis]
MKLLLPPMDQGLEDPIIIEPSTNLALSEPEHSSPTDTIVAEVVGLPCPLLLHEVPCLELSWSRSWYGSEGLMISNQDSQT